jgi:ferric-dicitrate binding protein FerR (iron transport regulator)
MGVFSDKCVFIVMNKFPRKVMKDQFSELVSKVLAGEAGDDEKKMLQQMLRDSGDNSLLFSQIKEYWDADVTPVNKRNSEKFVDDLVSKLTKEQRIQPSKLKKLYLRVASIAAMLFFATTCTLYYLYNTTAPEHFYTYSAQTIPADYVLADGTVVKLNKNSSITFLSDYGNERREVQLKGEAFFKVTKDVSRPFIVEAYGTKTEVLGTSFNVKANLENVTTTLVEGAVKFRSLGCEEILRPGEEICYNTSSRQYNRYATDVQLNTAWVSGRFSYNNISFQQLLDKLEQIYKLNIEISDQKIANRIVSASFLNEEPIEDILGAMEAELGFSYKMKDSTQVFIVSRTKGNK